MKDIEALDIEYEKLNDRQKELLKYVKSITIGEKEYINPWFNRI